MRQILRTRAAAVSVLVLVAAAVALIAGGAMARSTDGAARAQLIDSSGARIGVVQFLQQGNQVLVKAKASGLTPGFHGFHVHANDNPANGEGCVAPSFVSADGHYNPGATGHGTHAGDLPVLFVQQNGEALARFATDAFSVSELAGLAVIVHAAPDNYGNIPARYGGADDATLATGDAGGRVACGVIE